MEAAPGPLGRTVCFVFACAVLSSCSLPAIEQRPLMNVAVPPIERPRISLTANGRPVHPGAAGELRYSLELVSSGYGTADLQQTGEHEEPVFTLRFRDPVVDGSPKDEERVEYDLSLLLPRKLAPELSSGVLYNLRFFHEHRDVFIPPAQGIMIYDRLGHLVYLLSIDDACPRGERPGGFQVEKTEDVAYLTTVMTPSGCTVMKEHRFLAVTAGSKKPVRMSPGQGQEFKTPEGLYRFVLFDEAVTEAEMECRAESPVQFTWMIQRLEARE